MKKIITIILMLILAFGLTVGVKSATAGTYYKFTPVNDGLYGTNVTCIEIDANNPNIVYLGTVNEGIFVSQDSGKTWQWIGKGLNYTLPGYVPSYLQINTIKTVKGKLGAIYVGTGAGLYFSNDGGNTFTNIGQGLMNRGVFSIYIDPFDTNHLIVGTDLGVFVSLDGGYNFTAYNKDIPNIIVYTIVKDISLSNSYFIGTNSGIFKTLDNCKTWRSIGNRSNIQVFDIVQNPKKPFIIYAATQGGVFRSYTSGESFVNLTDWPNRPFVFKIMIDSFDDSKVYAVYRQGFLKSSDYGETFTIIPNTTQSTFKTCVFPSVDFSTVYVGTEKGFLVYSNGYFSYSNKGLGLLNATSLGYDPNYKIIYTTTNLGTFKTDFNFSTWTYISNSLYGSYPHSISVDPSNPYNMFAATKYGLKKSIDNGIGWFMVDLPQTEMYSVAFSLSDPKYVFASGISGLFYSEDSGNSWNQVDLKGISTPIYSVVPAKNNYVYIMNNLGIYRSSNLVQWEKVSDISNYKASVLACDYFKSNVLYLGTLDGIFISTDGGFNFTPFGDLPKDTTVFSIVSLNDSSNTIVIATNRGVYRSEIANDNIQPSIILYEPKDGDKFNQPSITVRGKVSDNESGVAEVFINGNKVQLNEAGEFSYNLVLLPNDNTIEIKAYDRAGNMSLKTLKVTYIKTIVLTLFVGSNKLTSSDGSVITLDSPPVIIEGRTLVPIRPIIEKFGGSISWDGTERKVTIMLGNKTLELWIDKPQARVNGVLTWIDPNNTKVTPKIINGRTMLPVRFVSEQLGAKVEWDGTLRKITITYPAP
ncbi:stalk domain-containing protein [Caldisericum sp. AR60]|uniref:stalk domain-containing protein n=1 Tax=Caldisericum sp. AR60 TaxID=3397852 RepID=UPI0039FD12D2